MSFMEPNGKLNNQASRGLDLSSLSSATEVHKPLLHSSGIMGLGSQEPVLVTLRLNAKKNLIGQFLVVVRLTSSFP